MGALSGPQGERLPVEGRVARQPQKQALLLAGGQEKGRARARSRSCQSQVISPTVLCLSQGRCHASPLLSALLLLLVVPRAPPTALLKHADLVEPDAGVEADPGPALPELGRSGEVGVRQGRVG
jgi:hypothetical protein